MLNALVRLSERRARERAKDDAVRAAVRATIREGADRWSKVLGLTKPLSTWLDHQRIMIWSYERRVAALNKELATARQAEDEDRVIVLVQLIGHYGDLMSRLTSATLRWQTELSAYEERLMKNRETELPLTSTFELEQEVRRVADRMLDTELPLMDAFNNYRRTAIGDLTR